MRTNRKKQPAKKKNGGFIHIKPNDDTLWNISEPDWRRYHALLSPQLPKLISYKAKKILEIVMLSEAKSRKNLCSFLFLKE